MTYNPHAICNPCWFDEHDRCYGCSCVDDRHARTTTNSHRTPADGLTGSPEGEGLSTTTTTPQIATNPATDSTRNEDIAP